MINIYIATDWVSQRGGREGGRKGGREEGREGEREGGREGERETGWNEDRKMRKMEEGGEQAIKHTFLLLSFRVYITLLLLLFRL